MTARTEFLNDVITTAIEGGIGYWSQTRQYQWFDERRNEVRVVLGEKRPGGDATAVIHVLTDDEEFYEDEGRVIDHSLIRRGIRRIIDGDVGVNSRLRDRVAAANRESDAGLIDSGDADVIVQAGMFGEIVYG